MRRLTIAILGIFIAGSVTARAADMSAVLTDQSGTVIKDELDQTKPDLTLGLAAAHALVFQYPDEQGLSGEEKFRRGALALRIAEARGDLALTAEDTATVKKVIAKLYGPMVVLRTWTLLDPAVK